MFKSTIPEQSQWSPSSSCCPKGKQIPTIQTRHMQLATPADLLIVDSIFQGSTGIHCGFLGPDHSCCCEHGLREYAHDCSDQRHERRARHHCHRRGKAYFDRINSLLSLHWTMLAEQSLCCYKRGRAAQHLEACNCPEQHSPVVAFVAESKRRTALLDRTCPASDPNQAEQSHSLCSTLTTMASRMGQPRWRAGLI